MELKNFIDAYKQDGLRKIKDSTVLALKDGYEVVDVKREEIEP